MTTIVDEGTELLSVSDVAGMLGVSEPTVRAYIAGGALPAVHLGGHVRGPLRVTRRDLEAAMREWAAR